MTKYSKNLTVIRLIKIGPRRDTNRNNSACKYWSSQKQVLFTLNVCQWPATGCSANSSLFYWHQASKTGNGCKQ